MRQVRKQRAGAAFRSLWTKIGRRFRPALRRESPEQAKPQVWVFIWDCFHLPEEVSDQELIREWKRKDDPVYAVERISPEELARRINEDSFDYATDYVRFITM